MLPPDRFERTVRRRHVTTSRSEVGRLWRLILLGVVLLLHASSTESVCIQNQNDGEFDFLPTIYPKIRQNECKSSLLGTFRDNLGSIQYGCEGGFIRFELTTLNILLYNLLDIAYIG